MSQSELPYRWRLDGNYLMGITSDRWWSLLRQNQFRLPPAYWHRVLAITLASGLSSLLSQVETWRYGAAIDAVTLREDPVFILGHWRSGTTLLHELLVLNSERFAYANTFQVMSPQTFLLTEEMWGPWFAKLIPHHRPMDNMRLELRSPQEDEFAMALATLQSYYLALGFPQAEQQYERYLTLENLSPGERQQWLTIFLRFLKKLTLKYDRQLVLKSPPHTARIRLLLECFPKARFIHIHRHPYSVFQSMGHYFETAGWLTCLQKPDLSTLNQSILRRYCILYDAYFDQQPLIPSGQFYELSFADLVRDPVVQLKTLFQALDLPYTANFEARVKQYLKVRKSYRKNKFPPLDSGEKQGIHDRWQRAFDRWGYERDI